MLMLRYNVLLILPPFLSASVMHVTEVFLFVPYHKLNRRLQQSCIRRFLYIHFPTYSSIADPSLMHRQ